MKRRVLGWLGVGLALVAMPSRGGPDNRDGLPTSGSPTTISGRAMGTTWSVKFAPSANAPTIDAELVRQRVAARLEELEQQFSTYRPGSALSRFNASASTEWFAVPAELARVAEASRGISEATHGAFDPTVAPLLALWGFSGAPRPHAAPSAAAIATGRARVGWEKLEVRLAPPALRKARSDLAADFSSMAKGFSADAIGALLASLGAGNHLVQIGGDVKAAGAGPDGGGWRVAIENPLAAREAGSSPLARVVPLRGGALSTSGAQRNFVELGGERFGHIVDPRTGRPVGGALASVSVVAASCAESSAWATALFVLGADEGFALAERRGLAALFLVREGAALVARPTRAFAAQGGE